MSKPKPLSRKALAQKAYDKGYNDGRAAVAKEKGYNGWPNYETWAVKLLIDNEEWSQEHARELVRDTAQRAGMRGIGHSYLLANAIREWVEEMNPLNETPATMFHDLLNAALSEVDWTEIAENILRECD